MKYVCHFPKKKQIFFLFYTQQKYRKHNLTFFLGHFWFDLTFAVCLLSIKMGVDLVCTPRKWLRNIFKRMKCKKSGCGYTLFAKVLKGISMRSRVKVLFHTGARLLVENPFVEHDNSSNTTAGRKKRPSPTLGRFYFYLHYDTLSNKKIDQMSD